jgi:hypothetical protein
MKPVLLVNGQNIKSQSTAFPKKVDKICQKCLPKMCAGEFQYFA